MPRLRFLSFIVASLLVICLAGAASAQEPLWTYKSVTGVTGVSLSSNGSAIAVASDRLYVFTKTGEKSWAGPKSTVVQLSADATIVASGGDDGVHFFNALDGTEYWHDSTWTYVNHLAMTPDGRSVATGVGSTVAFYTEDGKNLWKNISATPRCVAISKDGAYVAFGRKGSVELYNRNGLRWWMAEIGGDMNAVAISPAWTYVAGSDENKLILWSKNGSHLWTARTANTIEDLAVSNDASYIVAGGRDSAVHLFNLAGSELWNATAGDWITCVDISKDGGVIAAGSMDRNVYLFNRQGELLWKAFTPSPVISVALSSDGKYVAAGTNDGTALFFSTTPSVRPDPTATAVSGGTTDPGVIPPFPVYSVPQTTSPSGPARTPGVTFKTTVPPATTPKSGGAPSFLLLPVAAGAALLLAGRRR